MKSSTAYQIYVELKDYEPKIWRRFQVSSSIKLSRFAYVLMTLFEMKGGHLFEFYSSKTRDRYALNVYEGLEARNANVVSLRTVLKISGDTLYFTYDLGDNWEIRIELEEVKLLSCRYPVVFGGAGYGIIEDCGGVHMLSELSQSIKSNNLSTDLDEEERKYLMNIDMDIFDVSEMNEKLRELPSFFKSMYEEDYV